MARSPTRSGWGPLSTTVARAYAGATVSVALLVIVTLCVLELLALDVLTDRGPAWARSIRPWPLRGDLASLGVDLGLLAVATLVMRRSVTRSLLDGHAVALTPRAGWVAAVIGMLGTYPVMPLTLPLRIPVALAVLVVLVHSRARPSSLVAPLRSGRPVLVGSTLVFAACLGWAGFHGVMHPLYPGSAGQADGAVMDMADIGGISTFRFRPERDAVFPFEIENEGLASATVLGVVARPSGADPLRVTGLRIAPPIPAEDEPALTVDRTKPFAPLRIPGRSTRVLALVLKVGRCTPGSPTPRLISSVRLRYRVLGRMGSETVRLVPSIAAACGPS